MRRGEASTAAFTGIRTRPKAAELPGPVSQAHRAASKGSQPRKREGSPTSREGRKAGFWGHASRSDGAARPHRCGREEAEQWTPQKLAQSRLSPASSPRKGFARRRRGWGEPTDNARSGASFDRCRLLRIQDGGAHMLRGRKKPFTRRRYRRPYQVHTVL